MITGYLPALITPFKNGMVDEKTFAELVERQIKNGSRGLVPVGTTGESPAVTHDEHKRITEVCIEAAAGRVPVVAGTGSNSTFEAVELSSHAKKAGADAILIVTPYYNKPTQEGLKAHFLEIANKVDIPLIIYNIPGRSVIDMTCETMAELAKHPNIVGVKDASADLTRPTIMRNLAGKDFNLLTGEDGTSLPFWVAGGHGCISVTANIAPRLCADLFEAWERRDMDTALELHAKLTPLHSAMFCTTSPGPVKYAAEVLGLCSSEMRLPMVDISQAAKTQVEEALKSAGLI
ncbi:MAG: 4-hydroxy-tetrahydrodipicolinate synthase [Alphaproteobacteria bacterium]